MPTFPRLWDLLGLIFCPKFRERIYTPSVEADKADYYRAMKAYRTRAARWWLRLCFLVRTVVRLGQCFAVLAQDKTMALFAPLLPGWLRKWWRAR